ncbi:MAG: MFS transporter [Propionibacteriaceae bacterium]|jgi:MFS family permease|nr:MFS transporter [Propionibacteriaceae bacterium]
MSIDMKSTASRILFAVIAIEFVDGILGAYYTPLVVPLARSVGLHDSDWNWVEAAQTLLGAIVIPLLTRFGDRFGHKKAMLVTVIVTAGAAWWVVAGGGFVSVLLAFSLLSFSSVWMALELALVRSSVGEGADADERVSATSAALIVAFMIGSVGAAIFGGQFFTASGGWDALQGAIGAGVPPSTVAQFTHALRLTLLVPAIGITVLVPLVVFLVPETKPRQLPRQDLAGLVFLIGILVLIVGGLSVVKLLGLSSPVGWIVIGIALVLVYPFGRHQLRTDEPTLDLRLLRQREVWPFQAMSLLLGVGYTATQIPLITFASTDPASAGFGLAADTGDISIVMAVMILAISITAGLLTAFGKRVNKLTLLRLAPFIHACEFIIFLFLHTQMWHAYLAVGVGGVGAGILVAWLPAAAANAAPPGKTATLVGLTSLTRVIGTALGSAAFAVILSTVGHQKGTAASLAGYLTVFSVAIAASVTGGILLRAARPPLSAPITESALAEAKEN